jgi:acyl transferase domain-containing protein
MKNNRSNDDIAVIGMAGKFPMADNLEEFWENLKNGKDCIGDLPGARYEDWAPVFGEGVKDMPQFGYLRNINQFDPHFFGIAPGEAFYMDPSQRLLLETVYEALAYGGYGGNRLAGTGTGVFIACSESGYKELIPWDDFSMAAELGTLPAVSAGRISHIFDMRGPSLLIDTACSSSLAALHYACESIKRGECFMAVVGAVSVYAYYDRITAAVDVNISRDTGEEPGEKDETNIVIDHHCRVFDSSANSVVNGEGVAALLLKPVKNALDDGDVICAVIKGTAINHNGGRTPTVSGQKPESLAEVVSRALEKAGINPETLSYIEASGAATIMGDAIEIKSITDAISKYTDKKQFCAVGSVKANIGHLNHASGLASVIKVILALQHKKIPPLALFKEPNPYIDFKNSPVYIDTRLKDWELGKNKCRRAGISSFSVNGTNCHVITEEAPQVPPGSKSLPARSNIVTLSAKDAAALKKLGHILTKNLREDSGFDFGDICYSMNTGRGQYEYRLAAICKNREEFVDLWNAFDRSGNPGIAGDPGIFYSNPENKIKPGESKAVFLFSGGKKEPETCWDFYHKGFIAAKYMDECGALFELEKYPKALIFAFQYALANLWMDIGIKPAYVLGFGIGKYVSRVISGKLELAGALRACVTGNIEENSFNRDKFRTNIELLYTRGQRLFLEIGTGNELGSVTKEVLTGKPGFTVLDSYGREDNERTLLKAIASLYTRGSDIDFLSLFPGRMVVLPTYPFNRRRYWLDAVSIDSRVRTRSLAEEGVSDEKAGFAEIDNSQVEMFTGQLIPRPVLSTEYVAPGTGFEKIFAGILKEFLGFEKVGIHDNFFEFGVNSVTMLHINRILKKKLKKDIPIVSMFEYPTIHSLGEHLAQKGGEAGRSDEVGDGLDTIDTVGDKGIRLLDQSIGLLRNIPKESEGE